MNIAIMQPYFFPYIGYFQLINAVDEFIVYDNVQYTKKGWINRNRILSNKKISYITLPIKKNSDYLDIKDRYLANTWNSDKIKLLNKINSSYKKAPEFDVVYPLIQEILLFKENNLFKFIFNSLDKVKNYLMINKPFFASSEIPINHNLKSKEKVVAMCFTRKADIYINPIGGLDLYSKEYFKEKNIDLFFLKTNDMEYNQLNNKFIPNLSIIDMMMFNPLKKIRESLNNYKLF
jgi:hypothetical protein